LKIGLPKEFFGDGLDHEVKSAIEQAQSVLKDLGASFVPISLPKTELSIPVYYIIAPAEASSNLSRFDGVRYGHRAKEYTDLMQMYKKSRAEGFGAEVKKRIMTGAYVLSHGYYDAYYLQAQKIRRMIAEDFKEAFTQCDLILGPVAPSTAWGIGEKTADPLSSYLADIFTLPASLAGLPAMSVPCGMSQTVKPLPIGMQLIGNYVQESKLLNVAHQYQLQTQWHTMSPADSTGLWGETK
jgi:aspartyl-tRNA(Asn)/glutamyl-tRNA(Gln) amidotransferase subunit A